MKEKVWIGECGKGGLDRFLDGQMAEADGAHDRAHILRVVAAAKRLAVEAGAELAVVVPAAWLHDCVVVAKDSPDRAKASVWAGGKRPLPSSQTLVILPSICQRLNTAYCGTQFFGGDCAADAGGAGGAGCG